ncbi:DedA family protein [Thermus scotoductus]|uniref:DedA family protein n=1 Tax=Thermus scotoductus TaxID=37636 RepID=UPI00242C0557|nr:VTT domain-containing protein [Thermus scotoductus]
MGVALDAKSLLETLSYPGLFALPLAETGLLFGFFLPGDSFLVTVGLFAAAGHLALGPSLLLLFLGSFLGHQLGYFWGRRLGKGLKARMRPDHWEKTEAFLRRRGALALLLAPLIPVVRTGMPFVAGAFAYPYPRFLSLSFLGTLLWTQGVTLLGYFLGRALPGLDRYLLLVVGLVVLVSFLPALWEARQR